MYIIGDNLRIRDTFPYLSPITLSVRRSNFIEHSQEMF